MVKTGREGDPLFGTCWVHVFEEDTPDGAVYRPEDDDIPLARRPREKLDLRPDGTATVTTPGADDRHVARAATWREDGGHIVVRTQSHDAAELHIAERSPRRLVIRRR